ncbi:hypothetical protein COU56_01935, partial [Candidatus Pacearchaeota archaeon CG10_big_fil_rev_8_21_14_0_10_31_9]
MKVLIIRSEDLFEGGEQVYVTKLIHSLVEKGHEVFYIILNENSLTKRSIKLNKINLICPTKIIDYDLHNKFYFIISNNLINFWVYLKLRSLVLSFNPDIIHLHNLKLVKTALLAFRGFPKVQTIHNISSIFPLYPHFFDKDNETNYDGKIKLNTGRLIGLKFRTILFDYIIFGNDWIKKRTIKYFLCPSKHLTNLCKNADFENAIHFPHFQVMSDYHFEKIKNLENKDYLLFVGRLDKIKGVDYLLEAFKIVHEKNKSLKLVIVGNGPEKENLIKLSYELGINKIVVFAGWIDNTKLGEYYLGSLMVVMPSLYPEASPLVSFEAMNYSKLIIAYNSGGLADLVNDGYNGFLVERFDIKGLADKINFIL